MTGTLPNHCPCCNQRLIVIQLHCEECGTNLTGSFVSPFHQFSEDEQLFIRNFVLHSGSIKSVARQMGKSYPTVRKMLNNLIKQLD